MTQRAFESKKNFVRQTWSRCVCEMFPSVVRVEYHIHADGSEASITLESTDHYLTGETTPPKDVTVLGGKTGTTSDAGNCLALLVQNAYGQPYVCIVMNASTKEILYQQMNTLLSQING